MDGEPQPVSLWFVQFHISKSNAAPQGVSVRSPVITLWRTLRVTGQTTTRSPCLSLVGGLGLFGFPVFDKERVERVRLARLQHCHETAVWCVRV